MKIRALLILVVLSVSMFAQEYWIQVLNVKERAPESFMQKVVRSGQNYKVLETSSDHKIWIGSYASRADAEKALNLVRCRIASDAFIVQEAAKAPTVEQVPEELAVSAGRKPAVSGSKDADTASKKAVIAAKKPAVTGRESVQEESRRTEKVETAKTEQCICICDKKALRKAEIGNAMSFYKNSPDYHFTGKDETGPDF
ncbi:MAG: SPOR domain-containing protein [Campylobacterota bacterium]|nr:SPOR domain-containing protein [Campylobacterota bacterium]